MTNCVVQASQLSAIQDLNFDLERRGELTPENGWHLDDYCQPLPPSRPAGRWNSGTCWKAAFSASGSTSAVGSGQRRAADRR